MQKKDNIKESKKDIDAMLNMTTTSTLEGFATDVIQAQVKRMSHMDFVKLKEESEIEAANVIASLINFYFTEEEIHSDYIQSKIHLDVLQYASLIFQTKTSDYSLMKLLEQIDEGNFNASTHRALSELQNAKMNIIKHFTQIQALVENGYKMMRLDFDSKAKQNELLLEDGGKKLLNGESEWTEVIEPSSVTVVRGTKNLLRSIQKSNELDDDSL